MEKEFNLSEKIQEGNPSWITTRNIKEFIKIIKDYSDNPEDEESLITITVGVLNELAGPKLITKS